MLSPMPRWNAINQAKVIADLKRTGSMEITARNFGVTRQRIQQISANLGIKKVFVTPTRINLTKANHRP